MKIHAIQTGTVQVKASQRVGRGRFRGLTVLIDQEWTEPLPILAWAVESSEGIIVVDTGETSRAMEPGYFPRRHPYFRRSVRVNVTPDQEIGPQLLALGIKPCDVKAVVMTHLHTDHAGGLGHFPGVRTIVHSGEYRQALGIAGRLRGYLPNRWPVGFAPEEIHFGEGDRECAGPFDFRRLLTRDGRVSVVPTPGHTFGHVSVIVEDQGVDYFLAGDATYTQQSLLDRQCDGVSGDVRRALKTFDAILRHANARPTVYLPSHDPESIHRLEICTTLPLSADEATDSKPTPAVLSLGGLAR